MPESHKNGGLPKDSPAQGGRLPLVSSSEKQTLTVCLVDDDASVLKATGRLLSSAGWIVKAFSDPLEFLRYAKIHHPKVVVLDILMPVMNGLEVQSRLHAVSPSSRVVVLTSKDDESVRSKAKDQGASAFFLKPVIDEEFLAGVQAAFVPD